MPRFKRLQKKQNSVQSVSQPVAESGPSFLQSTSCLPTHRTMSVRATTHLAPSFQPTSQATPTPQSVSQPSRSVHSISHPAPMDQAAPQPASAVHPASQPSQSVHSTSNLASTDQDSPQPALSVHSTSHLASTDQDSPQPAPTVQAASKKRSRSHWIVDAIDSEENIRKLRVKVNEVINLTCEERIVVDFDYLDEPFGDGRGLLSRFCGILACDCSLFPINFEKWLSLPISYFNRVFDQIIKPKFFFRTTESVAMGHIYKSIGKKWAANKNNLWRTHEDLLKSKTEMIESVPDGIPRDQ
ncbi:uncharacterized protein LOC132636245 [Lycium barbarum]|uniref:uncharacterized protein LOC132636245 n=1 Tax=Lycium barbarum TaxID=112863 RepID=UPI00293F0B95|nr:uncharacterized protein LOC132636245 [Lycium barbarum]XP_060208977.1 uncharacterized protein LOC132636245 [Lycium barbarum]